MGEYRGQVKGTVQSHGIFFLNVRHGQHLLVGSAVYGFSIFSNCLSQC